MQASTGFPNSPIELSATRLAEKAAQRNHEFEISDIKDLVKAINSPLAVFSYGNKNKAQNVIVDLEREGKHFVVGVHFNQNYRGIEVSDIRGLFNKDNAEWLNWITQGKSLYLDKEKVQNLINQQRTNLAEVEYLDLDSIAKIVENFENPKILEENIFDSQKANGEVEENRLFRTSELAKASAEKVNLQQMTDYAHDVAEALNVNGDIEVVTSEGLTGKKKQAKGWYDTKTGKITIVADNHTSLADMEQTMLHEAVAHKGLRVKMHTSFIKIEIPSFICPISFLFVTLHN